MSSYVEKTLADDESIVHRAHFNWTYSFIPFVWSLIGAAPLAMLCYIQLSKGLSFEELSLGWWFAIAATAVGLLILLCHMVAVWTTEIVVTTYRFVYKTGLISRHTQEVSLNKIEEITLKQSIWGRIFGFGKLILRGTGVGVIQLPDLDDPIEVRKIIENAKSNLRRTNFDDRSGDTDL